MELRTHFVQSFPCSTESHHLGIRNTFICLGVTVETQRRHRHDWNSWKIRVSVQRLQEELLFLGICQHVQKDRSYLCVSISQACRSDNTGTRHIFGAHHIFDFEYQTETIYLPNFKRYGNDVFNHMHADNLLRIVFHIRHAVSVQLNRFVCQRRRQWT